MSIQFSTQLVHATMELVREGHGAFVSGSWSARGGEVIADWGLGDGRDGVIFETQEPAEEAGELVGTVEVLCYHNECLYAQLFVHGTIAQIAAGVADFFEEPLRGLPEALAALRVEG